jgi:hypothetical protein
MNYLQYFPLFADFHILLSFITGAKVQLFFKKQHEIQLFSNVFAGKKLFFVHIFII